MHNPHPLDYRYLEDYIEDIEENNQIQVIEEDCEIAPGISVMHTPVHTKGGLSVIIETENGKAVITGFGVIKENCFPPNEIKNDNSEPVRPLIREQRTKHAENEKS